MKRHDITFVLTLLLVLGTAVTGATIIGQKTVDNSQKHWLKQNCELLGNGEGDKWYECPYNQ